jgi:hypothetical protein
MKNKGLLILCLLALVGCERNSSVAIEQPEVTILLQNRGSFPLVGLYSATQDSSSWSAQLLALDTLDSGQAVVLPPRPARSTLWIKALYDSLGTLSTLVHHDTIDCFDSLTLWTSLTPTARSSGSVCGSGGQNREHIINP